MSKRRIPGEIVIKKAMSGFIKNPCIIKIPTLDDFKRLGFPYTSVQEDHDSCMCGCGDSSCVEYANVLIVANGEVTDECIFHVSECQMEDIV